MIYRRCPYCQGRIFPLKSWARIEKFIVCQSCQKLSAVDRSNKYLAGIGGVGGVALMGGADYLAVSPGLLFLVIAPMLILLDLASFKVRRVGTIEGLSVTGRK